MSTRYQRGSLRREPRTAGDVWVWRYRVSGVMRQETYPVAQFPTKSAVWLHLQPAIEQLNSRKQAPVKVNYTVSEVIEKFREIHIPSKAKSTQDMYEWLLTDYIEPRWGKHILNAIHPGDVDEWVKSFKVSSLTKAHIVVLFRMLFKKAMLWRQYPVGVNPLSIITVEGATEREEEPELLSPDQVVLLVSALRFPYNIMVLVASALGLRVSELVSLKWEDFDLDKGTVYIRRSYTRQVLREKTKSKKSKAKLPVGADLLELLRKTKPEDATGWVFPSPRTDKPLSAGTILTKHIKPTAKELGLPKIGWHDLRHSWRSWISAKAELTVQKDMSRHADVSTTANIYGRTPIEDMRPVADQVASSLKIKLPVTTP